MSGKDAEIFLEATKIENVKPLPLNELQRMEKNWKLFQKALDKGEDKEKFDYYYKRFWYNNSEDKA